MFKMKKRLLSVLLVAFMMLQCAVLVSADDWTENLNVNIDMEVKQSSGASFVNGPLVVSSSNTLADFKATLEMSAVKAKFEQWYNTSKNVIKSLYAEGSSEYNTLLAELRNFQVTGQFTIEILYPKALVVPAVNFQNNHTLYGFNADANYTFYELSRAYDTSDPTNNKVTITIAVKKQGNADGDNFILAGDLYDNKDTYLNDLVLTFTNVSVPDFGTYTVKGTMQGQTYTGGTIGNTIVGNPNLPKTTSLTVNYTGVQKAGDGFVNPELPAEISTTIKLVNTPSGGGSAPIPSLKFNVDGKSDAYSPIYKKNIKLSELPKPQRAGFEFVGWFYDSAYTNKVDKDLVLTKNTVLYGYWVNKTLDNEEHFAYIIGYPDGTVKPQNNITREEVATIFYRLLREEARAGAMTTENNFSDVSADRWSNKAISTLAKGGFINGYEDGTFAPGNYITRAEFVTMATAFSTESAQGTSSFSDISGHWAEDYIIEATTLGWIKGYEDGTFAPGKYITRAEAMTIINRMLSREVDAAGLHADTKLWSDINASDWYYYNVLEATNSHNYNRTENGLTESWTSINENKIWSELDKMENPN